MSYPVMPLGFLGSQDQGDNDSYKIERSLRFNSADSAYLNRTPASAGNRKTWTWSGWVKRGAIARGILFGASSTSFIYFSDQYPERFSVYDSSAVSGGYNIRVTNQLFRDPSAWYHFVVSTDTTQSTASNRVKLYVNGSEITSFFDSNNPAQDAQWTFNSSVAHYVGFSGTSGAYSFDGYLTEINFIDGQALTPSSFGETDAITGRWKAKAYSGTYGTNGFYLNFADNSGTTSTTLGKDSSPNGNNWTPNNFSVTAGAGNDSLVDSPTNYGTDSGVGGEVRGNYATFNPLYTNFAASGTISLTDGNLRYSSNTSWYSSSAVTHAVKTGKWYFEVKNTSTLQYGNSSGSRAGVYDDGKVSTSFNQTFYANSIGTPTFGGSISKNIHNGTNVYVETSTVSGDQIASGDILNIAFDCDSGKVWFGKNGTWSGSSNPATNTGGHSFSSAISGSLIPFVSVNQGAGNTDTIEINFGQRPFAYTAPSGFKALCTTNLPTPTIQKPSKYMDVVTRTGTGATASVTGLSFAPDLIWVKARNNTRDHGLYDIVRGANKALASNLTSAEQSLTNSITQFNSNGYALGSSAGDPNAVNLASDIYVDWIWDEAPIAGMDIVSFTGNGGSQTISHNLGIAPKMIICKARGNTQDWYVYHSSIGNTGALLLNSTAATQTSINYWANVSPTSFGFAVGPNFTNLYNYIAYAFAEVEGFSKFGSYTGNGSADGPFVYCGFRPRWVMIKQSSTSGNNWQIIDAARSDFNFADKVLFPNTSGVETTANATIDIVSSGFKIRTVDGTVNTSSATYIFAAFAESAYKYARAR